MLQPASENEFGEDVWGCGPKRSKDVVDFPHIKRNLLHPCHHASGACCGGNVHAPAILRLHSYIHVDNAAVQITYDAHAVCGDGFDFLVGFLLREGISTTAHGDCQSWSVDAAFSAHCYKELIISLLSESQG